MSKIIEESVVSDVPIAVSDGEQLYYLKLVKIGPETLEKVNNLPVNCVRQIDGHFIVGQEEELRVDLKTIIDRIIDHE